MGAEHRDVAAETFNAAAAQEDAALAAYESAKVQKEEAAHVLNAISCRTSFSYEVPGPYEDDVAVIEGECALQAGHDGDHADDYRQSGATLPAYREAVGRYLDAEKQASIERGH